MWQSEKSLLLEEKVSAVRLTDEVRAGSIKLVIAHASGGILFCAHRKVRKRSVKGERAFYKDALSPLKSPYPPTSETNPNTRAASSAAQEGMCQSTQRISPPTVQAALEWEYVRS